MLRAEVAAAYDARADEYVAKLGSVEQMAPQDRETIEAWRDTIDGRILDAGCGPGHWTDVLSFHHRRDVLGVDASTRFVSSAHERFPDVNLVVGDLDALPVATSAMGGVLAWFSIIHTPPTDAPKLIDEFARVLALRGSLLLGFFDGKNGEPFDHAVTTAYYWSTAELGALLTTRGFDVKQASARQDPGARRQGHLLATLER